VGGRKNGPINNSSPFYHSRATVLAYCYSVTHGSITQMLSDQALGVRIFLQLNLKHQPQ
jgi:hypothetical protein